MSESPERTSISKYDDIEFSRSKNPYDVYVTLFTLVPLVITYKQRQIYNTFFSYTPSDTAYFNFDGKDRPSAVNVEFLDSSSEKSKKDKHHHHHHKEKHHHKDKNDRSKKDEVKKDQTKKDETKKKHKSSSFDKSFSSTESDNSFLKRLVKKLGKPSLVYVDKKHKEDSFLLWSRSDLKRSDHSFVSNVKMSPSNNNLFVSIDIHVPREQLFDVLRIHKTLSYDRVGNTLTCHSQSWSHCMTTLYLACKLAKNKTTLSEIRETQKTRSRQDDEKKLSQLCSKQKVDQ